MAKKDLRAQQFLTDPFARDGGEFLYIPLYDYYKKYGHENEAYNNMKNV